MDTVKHSTNIIFKDWTVKNKNAKKCLDPLKICTDIGLAKKVHLILL